ncbi:MAG: hypothetical protein MUC54_06620, partial [Chloroflexi bacterium]|nr:hypothetical protein [Chloroflexota bacterium]
MWEPEAAVAVAALGVQDPELRPAAGRTVAVAGDPDLCPLADDLPPEPDPALAPELEAQADSVENRAETVRQACGLEHHQERPGPPSEDQHPVQPIGRRWPTGAGHRGQPG